MVIATLALIGVGLCALASIRLVLAPTGRGRDHAENDAFGLMAAGVIVLLGAAAINAAAGG